MADFRTGDIGVESPYTPQQPLVDTTASQGVDIAQGALDIFSGLAQQKAEGKVNSALVSFEKEQLKWADAVDQGVMSSQEARMNMRASYARHASNNPALAEELAKRQKTIISQAGLGKVMAEGTAQEQAQIRLEQEAISKAWVNPGDPPAQRQLDLENYRDYLRVQQQMSDLQKKASLESTLIGNDASKLSLMQNKLKEKQMGLVTELAQTYTPKFRGDMQKLIQQVESGELSQEEAVMQAKNNWNAVQSVINQVGPRAGGEILSTLSKPMQNMYENTLEHLNGKMSLEVLNNQNAKVMALMEKEWMKDPELAALAVGSKLLPNSDILDLEVNLSRPVMDHLKRMKEGNKPPNLLSDTPQGKKEATTTLNIVKSNLKKFNSGGMDDETVAEIDSGISSIMRSIDVYSASVDDPSEYQPLINFFSDPQYGQYAKQKGGVLADNAVKVKQIIQSNYENVVIPLLKREYESDSVSTFTQASPFVSGFATTGKIPVAQYIKPRFTGSGVSFQMQEGPESNNPRLRAKIKSLNERVAPTVNKLIRMSAHFEGSDNYKKVYEDNYAYIFGEELPEDQKSSSRTTEKSQPQPKLRAPAIGEIINGFEFMGGNPNDQSSWRKSNG